MTRPKLCRITTVPVSLGILMEGQLEEMRRRGFELTAVSSPGAWLERVEKERGIRTLAVPMTRAISPLKDLLVLWRLYRLFSRERFDIVHSHTPKAGLLGMLAARFAGVPVRIHTFAGTTTDDIQAFKWRIVKLTDRLTALAATRCLAISPSLQDLLLGRGVCPESKIEVLGSGSSNGVDLERFRRTPEVEGRGRRTRQELGISERGLVILFVGRVVKDKGIMELVTAFRTLGREDTHLVVVGPREEELDPLPDWVVEEIERNPRIHAVGFQRDVEAYLASSDLLAVPTYREGFGNVFIQAAALERPVVGTRIPGVVDSVKEGISGYLVPPRDHASLAKVLNRFLSDRELRLRLGRSGRKWVEENFAREHIWDELEKVYRKEIDSRGLWGTGHGICRRLFDKGPSKVGACR